MPETVESLNLETKIEAQFREETFKYIRVQNQYNVIFNANKIPARLQKQKTQRNKKYSVNLQAMQRGQKNKKQIIWGNSLVVQWLGFCAFTAEGPGSIPGQGTSGAAKKRKKSVYKIFGITCPTSSVN